MTFESAHPDDFDEIQNLYWDLFPREDNHEYLIDKLGII